MTAVNQAYPNPTVKISAVSDAQKLLYLVSSPPVKNGNHEISYIDIDGGPVRIYYGIQVTDRSNIHIHHCYLHDCISHTLWTRAIKVASSEADDISDWRTITPYDGRDLDAWHAKWTFAPVENMEIDHCTIIDWGRTPTDHRAGTGGILPKGWKGGSIHDCYFEATDPCDYIKFIPPNADYHLKSNSPAIDAGVDVGLPYVGSAPDIGDYEYAIPSDLDGDGCVDIADLSMFVELWFQCNYPQNPACEFLF